MMTMIMMVVVVDDDDNEDDDDGDDEFIIIYILSYSATSKQYNKNVKLQQLQQCISQNIIATVLRMYKLYRMYTQLDPLTSELTLIVMAFSY